MIEIDGVRSALEWPVTEAGDYIAHEYWRLIDLATSPERSTPANVSRLQGAIHRLNLNNATASFYLSGTEYGTTFNNAVEQINKLNQDIEMETLKPVADDVPAMHQWSGIYRWN